MYDLTMLTKPFACIVLIAGGLCLASGGAFAQDAGVKPHVPLQKTIGVVTPTGPVPSLFVVNSAGAKLEGGKLTMTGVAPNSIVFADRPVRAAGHVTTEQFIMQWDEGADNFIKDPPNATISVLGGDGSKVEDAVVTLKSPKIEAGSLTFEVSVLEGSLSGSSGPAALFIDRGGVAAVAAVAAAAATSVLAAAASVVAASLVAAMAIAVATIAGSIRAATIGWEMTITTTTGMPQIYHGAWYTGAPATNPDLYYNANSIDCTSPRAQSEGYC